MIKSTNGWTRFIIFLFADSHLLEGWKAATNPYRVFAHFIVGGADAVTSFCTLSVMPGNTVFSPDKMVLAYRSLRMSTSHFMMEL